jgi:hypothetical protein
MQGEIIPYKANELEDRGEEVFSAYTHPRLEEFIQRVIDGNRSFLPTETSRKLVREFFLYGFLRVSGEDFLWWNDQKEKVHPAEEAGLFYTNNGILAVSDFDREVYIRGGDSYHAYIPNVSSEPQGVEGTLLHSGYKASSIYVPHSNGDIFSDEKRENLFRALLYFSREVRNLRGEPTSGLIIKDFSKPEPPAPYKRRDSKLPRIVLKDTILIPGNRERTIEVSK